MIYSVQDRMEDKLIRLGWLKIDRQVRESSEWQKERETVSDDREIEKKKGKNREIDR